MTSAKDGACLDELIAIAIPVCKEAERRRPRTGPGRKPEIPDWVMTVLIMVVTLKKKKSKGAQYRWIMNHQDYLLERLDGHRLPCRSTYYDRFRRACHLLTEVIQVMGEKAVRYGWADASTVSVDKSMMHAKGPKWWKNDRKKNRLPLPGIDQESEWGFSSHHDWVQGYSFEVVVSSGNNGVIWPLLASSGAANESEHKSFVSKIDHLPKQSKFVLADAGYDNGSFVAKIEWDGRRRTGVRFLCPQNSRGSTGLAPKRKNESRAVYSKRVRRAEHRDYFRTQKAQRQYRRRTLTVEPFNEWFKSAFEFSKTVWHRGLANNRTQTLAAIFCYQVLLRQNITKKFRSGKIRPLLDAL